MAYSLPRTRKNPCETLTGTVAVRTLSPSTMFV